MGEIGPRPERGAQELLAEFQQTGQEAPFAEIARRYAGMVYNVALRVTRDAHDAEDATQATFLTLAIHAKTAGKIRFVGPWLKKVSHRLALDIRRSKTRRKAREQRHAEGNGHANGNGNGHDLPVSNGMDIEELRFILRDEIDKLPAKYRLPLILYYFGGLNPEQISKELHCNGSTLGVRLHRGRKMLADSLSARGVSVTAALVAGMLTGLVDSFVKDNLVHYASQASSQVAAGGFVADSVMSQHVLGLMRSATAAIRWSRIKAATAILVLLASTLAGASEVLQRYNLVSPEVLRKIDPRNLIRPLLDRAIPVPRLRVETPMPAHAAPVASGNYQLSPLPPLPQIDLTPPPMAVSAPPEPRQRTAVAAAPVVAPASPVGPLVVLAPPTAQQTAQQAAPAFQQTSAPSSPLATSAPLVGLPPAPLIVDGKTGNFGKGGLAMLTGGSTHAKSLVVGDGDNGSLIHRGGELRLDDGLVVGNKPGSNGTYAIKDSARLDTPKITVGASGNGKVVQDGGQVTVATANRDGTVTVGDKPGSTGSYVMKSGTLSADNAVIGNQGQGTFDQQGGTTNVTVAQLGKQSGGAGTLSVTGGVIHVGTPVPVTTSAPPILTPMSAGPVPLPTLIVGGDGSGTVMLQADGSGAAIQETPGQGASLYIRSHVQGDGTVRGFGDVQITGKVSQNGIVIADGAGLRRALDFSSASTVTSTIENSSDGENGWYARNGGSIVLPPIKITGTRFYTWGEEPIDNVIDLVNSVRFRPLVQGTEGTIDISLLDPENSDAPGLPGDLPVLGLWRLNSSIDYSAINLLIRYDAHLAEKLEVPESDINLWVYDGGWRPLTNDSMGIDSVNHLLWGTAGKATYFAAAPLPDADAIAMPTPEPGGITLLLIGAGSLLVRRRRTN